MAESDPLRKYLDAGIALTQLTRARAETIVKELVKAGELQREQAQDRVEELLDRSRKSTDGLLGLVRREVAQQLASMGFATKQDLEQLEARLEGRLAASAASAPKPARKPPAPAPPKVAPSSSKAAPAPSRAAPASTKTAAAPPGTAARAGATAATKAATTAGTARAGATKARAEATPKATAARRPPAPAVEPD